MNAEPLSRRVSQRERDRMHVEEAVDAALPLADPGYVYTHQWLEEQLDIGPAPADGDARDKWHTRKLGLVSMWREAMGARHVHTKTTRGDGYAVVPPADSVTVLQREAFMTMSKALRQGRERMEVWVDPNVLTPQQRQERIDAMGRVALLEHALKHARPKPPRVPTSAAPVRLLAASSEEDQQRAE